jgi:hypothetical protein
MTISEFFGSDVLLDNQGVVARPIVNIDLPFDGTGCIDGHWDDDDWWGPLCNPSN